MEYTKGPWKIVRVEPPLVEFTGWWIKKNDSVQFPIAFVTKTIGGTNPPQEANARLIASAPDLLEACISAKFHLIDDNPKKHEGLIKILEQAISKAEGK